MHVQASGTLPCNAIVSIFRYLVGTERKRWLCEDPKALLTEMVDELGDELWSTSFFVVRRISKAFWGASLELIYAPAAPGYRAFDPGPPMALAQNLTLTQYLWVEQGWYRHNITRLFTPDFRCTLKFEDWFPLGECDTETQETPYSDKKMDLSEVSLWHVTIFGSRGLGLITLPSCIREFCLQASAFCYLMPESFREHHSLEILLLDCPKGIDGETLSHLDLTNCERMKILILENFELPSLILPNDSVEVQMRNAWVGDDSFDAFIARGGRAYFYEVLQSSSEELLEIKGELDIIAAPIVAEPAVDQPDQPGRRRRVRRRRRRPRSKEDNPTCPACSISDSDNILPLLSSDDTTTGAS